MEKIVSCIRCSGSKVSRTHRKTTCGACNGTGFITACQAALWQSLDEEEAERTKKSSHDLVADFMQSMNIKSVHH